MSGGQTREWISSYVYGSITVLSAAIAVSPEQIRHGAAVWAILATGVLTFFAHVLAHLVAHGFTDADDDPHTDARSVVDAIARTARPIGTAALIPAALYAVAWIGLLPAAGMQTAAIVVLAVRIRLVGLFMQRLSGRRLTMAALWGGIALAVISLGIGAAKVLLTH